MVAPQTYVLKEALKEKSVDLPPRTELAAVPFFRRSTITAALLRSPWCCRQRAST